MTAHITDNIENMLNDMVKRGLYNSPQEAVNEAFRLLKERNIIREIRLNELRHEIQKGIDSANSEKLFTEQEIREHFDKRRKEFLQS